MEGKKSLDLRSFSGDGEIRSDELETRRAFLISSGFTPEWVNNLQHARATLYKVEVVQDHLHGLTQRGFKNPNKMIESSPAILGYAFENIDAKLAGLTQRGFKNPNKMIESLPAILGLAFENIDRKLNMIRKIFSSYKLPFQAPDFIEKESSLISSKIDKLWVVARICRTYLTTPEQIDVRLIHNLMFANIENLLVAIQKNPNIHTIAELLLNAKEIKKQNLDKSEKRRIIMEDQKSEIANIFRRYLRGYPPREEELQQT